MKDRLRNVGGMLGIGALVIVLGACGDDLHDHRIMARLPGVVTTAEGDPVAGARVEGEAVLAPCDAEGGSLQASEGAVTSGLDGGFTLVFGMPLSSPGPGCAHVTVTPPDGSALGAAEVRDVPVEFGITHAPPSDTSLTVVLDEVEAAAGTELGGAGPP